MSILKIRGYGTLVDDSIHTVTINMSKVFCLEVEEQTTEHSITNEQLYTVVILSDRGNNIDYHVTADEKNRIEEEMELNPFED